MGFNDGFHARSIDSISGSNGDVLTKVSGVWIALAPAGGGGGGGISSIVLDPTETNLSGDGTATTPLFLKLNPSFTNVTASAGFKGNGSQLTNLTASNIDNFQTDVRLQLSANSNLTYSAGQFGLAQNPSVTSVTASAGFSGSLFGTASYASEADKVDGYNASQLAKLAENNSFTGNQSVTGYVSASVGLTGSNNLLDSVTTIEVKYVPQAVAPSQTTGKTYFNDTTKDLTVWTDITGIGVNLGQQLVMRAKNSTGSQIAKGKVVYISGAAGDNPLITLSTNATEAGSARTSGITMAAIDDGDTGYVLLRGVLTGVDTLGMTAGHTLYLGTNGDLTETKPSAPAHEVRVGQVLRVQQNNGSIYVAIQNGYELEELHNISIVSSASYDLLVLDTDGLWKNTKTLAGNYTFSGQNKFTGSLLGTSSYASDSDKLDGYDSTAFPILSANNTFTGVNTFGAVTGSGAYFSGDIRVNGTASIALLQTLNQTALNVGEKYIVLMSGSTEHTGLDGSGYLWGSGSTGPTVDENGANAYIKYRAATDRLEAYPGLNVLGVLSSSNGITGSHVGDGSALTGVTASPSTSTPYTWTATQTFASGTTFSNGAIKVPIVAKTASYNIATTDHIVTMSGSALTASLPSAVTAGAGGMYIVKNLHTASMLVNATAGTIDGQSSLTVYNQYTSYTFVSDGSNWLVF